MPAESRRNIAQSVVGPMASSRDRACAAATGSGEAAVAMSSGTGIGRNAGTMWSGPCVSSARTSLAHTAIAVAMASGTRNRRAGMGPYQ